MSHGRLHLSRRTVSSWLKAGLRAVDPEMLTRQALEGESGRRTVIAIGKAAPAMCRGAAAVFESLSGICITDHVEAVPDGIDLVIGDHPVPGARSAVAGRRALDLAPHADLALISGGGSALCEVPIEGVSLDFLVTAHRSLIDHGVGIEEANLIRRHLSRVKCGGLGPIPTLVLSDVSGRGASIVSSGPTIPMPHDPSRALSLMADFGLLVPDEVAAAVARPLGDRRPPERIEVIGDGRLAAAAVADAASRQHIAAIVRQTWLHGTVSEEVSDLVDNGRPGVTIAVGEPTLDSGEDAGQGGRNTHGALLAAERIAGSDTTFAALATDGVDGSSGASGGIVDGGTVREGGDPGRSLERFDSATYLTATGDLLELGPTGTNVADLWLIWKPRGQAPILSG